MTLDVPPPRDADGYFGEDVASRYDDPADASNSPDAIVPAVDFLAESARGGPVLEFAIGTGRIAVPLAARGVEVRGIELSRAMLARLRAKPGGESIPVTVGDMSTTRVPGEFSLVYLVFNTIENLTTREDQLACFANAAAHLRPGGRFVIEVENPRPEILPAGQRYRVFDASATHWGIDEYDIPKQRMVSHHFSATDDGHWQLVAMPFRYVPPEELDEMASQAGLALVERWAGWRREPFTAESPSHVSVWEKAS